ncbi:PEP/pyruvate-binding domain-containing protein [Lacrimispora sp. 38-1]|uniref:PEP/pyruvate-binding domain-containing protein n=1 Tax=Lacrimispora sp. 38-1 TaxID=3125778 RepID=UPI003CEB7B01
MNYVMKFSEIRKEDISAAGGKGANLGELFNAGFPVPNGFCITSRAFDDYMKRNGFDTPSSKNNLTSENIAKGQLWKELEDEIAEYYHALAPDLKVAVRSSATAEDLPEASFAGQQETYLNIQGLEQLYLSVKKCFASLFSSRAAAYRKQTNFDTIKISLSVVVQCMVNSEISGVLFTVDPVSKNKSRMMLNASWGLGESIVSGKVTPDIYIYDRDHRQIIEKRLGDKKILICYSADGTEEKETSSQLRSEFSLTEKQAIEIFELGRKTEQHFQCPQDLEWAISQNRLYLLQARPITTLNVKNNSEIQLTKSQRAVLNNWIEHCPTPLYPLDVAPCLLVDEAKNKVFHELGIFVESELTMADNGLLSLSAGKIHISPKIFNIPFLLRSFTDYSINSARTNDSFHTIRKELTTIEKTDPSSLASKALIRQIMELMELSEELAYTRFRYNIFPSVAVSKLIHHDLKKIDKNMNEYDLLSNLSYKTWNLNIELKKLSGYIHSSPELEQLFMELDRTNPRAMSEFLSNQPYFKAKLQNFLNEFGWKSNSSYCAFGSVSWFENPDSLFSMLKVLQNSGRNEEASDKFQNIMTKITKQFDKKKARRLKTKIEEIRAYHVNREESLYMIEMCYGLARRAAFELANRFPQLFKQADDIRYLTLNEVYELPDNITDLKELISVRKFNRQKNEVLWSGFSIGTKTGTQNILTGVSGNGGRCRGRVRKILTQQAFDKMQPGDILLCRYTDPSWTPLFVLASAVISDTGGPLSHSAIVAREYNIPAVLGIGNATDLLEDGDEVFVDGSSGKVIILK